MRAAVEFIIPGTPVAWHRPRFRGKRGFKDADDRNFQVLVRHHAAQAVQALPFQSSGEFTFRWRLSGAFAVELICMVPNRTRRDVDNLAKNILDGLTGVIWGDDSHVVDLSVKKRLAANPYTWVRVERIGDNLDAVS